mgnify:CR=1 FL=1
MAKPEIILTELELEAYVRELDSLLAQCHKTHTVDWDDPHSERGWRHVTEYVHEVPEARQAAIRKWLVGIVSNHGKT